MSERPEERRTSQQENHRPADTPRQTPARVHSSPFDAMVIELALITLCAIAVLSTLPPPAFAGGAALLCYFPGRCLTRATGLEREWDTTGRRLLSLAASLAVAPAVLNPLWHWTHDAMLLLGSVWAVLMIASCGSWHVAKRRAQADREDAAPAFESSRTRWLAAFVALFIAFATMLPYWPAEPFGYPIPAAIHDYIKHHAVLFSLERRPLPLGNVFYAEAAAGPAYYYHFFYLIPATLRAWTPGVSIPLAFGLASALVGIATCGMVYLLTKRFSGSEAPATLAALLASLIGALDLIPLVVLRQPVVTIDAWIDNIYRIHNFLNQMTWSPQNVSGLLTALLGCYLLSVRGVWWRGWLVVGPLLAAGLVGSSVWVAAAVLPALVVIVLTALRQPAALAENTSNARRSALVRLASAAGTAALMLLAALPSILGYLEMSRRHGRTLTLEWPYQQHALLGRLVPRGPLANLLDLPWLLAIELGAKFVFPLFLAAAVWRRAWNDAGLRLLCVAAVLGIAGFATLRSHFTHDYQYNDFGQKVLLITMACGAVLAGCILRPEAGRARWWNPLGWRLAEHLVGHRAKLGAAIVFVTLSLGLLGTLWEAPLTSLRRMLPLNVPIARIIPDSARQAAREAESLHFMRHALPRDAVVQADPGAQRVELPQMIERQIGALVLERDTMVFQPRNRAAMEQFVSGIGEATRGGGTDAREMRKLFREFGVTHVYVGVVEREKWSNLERFEDARFFERIHHAQGNTLYRVRESATSAADEDAP